MAISETLLHCGSLLWMNSISCKSTRTSAGRSESRRVKNVSEMNVPFMQIGQMTRMLTRLNLGLQLIHFHYRLICRSFSQ